MNKSYSAGDLISMYYEREFSNVNETALPVFSLKYKFVIKKTFKVFKKKLYICNYEVPKGREIKFRRKTIVIVAILIFLALFTGCTVAYFISNNFRGEIHNDNTELFVIDVSNCPSIIEEKYFLSALPESFELTDEVSTPFIEYVCYENAITGETISFTQYVKSEFDSHHYNTEYNDFIEVEINGCYGLCLDLSNDEYAYSGAIWDNGDYILEITGNMTKDKLINIASTTKLSQ